MNTYITNMEAMNISKMKFFLLTLFLWPFMLSAQSPGGVGTTNLKLWNKANTGVTTSGSDVTAWTDQTATNTFTVTGTPQYDSAKYNYNPAIVFNGSSRFTGNTSISNITHAFAVGYFENSIGTSSSGAMMGISSGTGSYFFHTQGLPRHFQCSDGVATVDATPASNSIQFSILSEDLGRTPAANDMIRQNGTYLTNNGGDPAPFSGTPTLGSRGTQNVRSTSALVECIIYDASLSATDLNKVESYLAIKYGITLPSDYTNAAGSVVYGTSSYGNNIIGIARDDNSSLNQKQSHYSNDDVRLYLGTLASSNSGNSTTFASNAQFVIMGDNNTPLSFNQANTETPASLGIISRLDREWKITNTGFTGTFSIDIKPTTGSFDAARIRVLIDDDGNFTNAISYSPTISVSGGIITVSGLTTSMIATGATRYLTLAYMPAPGNVSNSLTFWLKADAGITQSAGLVSQWNDQAIQALHVTQGTASSQPTVAADTINYYPVVYFDGSRILTKTTGVAYNALVNVTSGINTNTTGSIFTVGRSTAATGNFFSQWNTIPLGAYIINSSLNSNAVNVGGRSSGVGNIPVADPAKPFISTALETSGTNNALHYLDGSNLQAVTNASNDASTTSSQYLRVGISLKGSVAEAITYNTKLTDNQRRQIESYLAIKYGITMSNTGGGTYGNYISSAGTTLWDAAVNSSYHRQVIGLGRDDSTSLLQKQSHTLDDTTRIYVSSLQSTNAANNGTFSSNASYIIMGNDGGLMERDGRTLSEFPPGQGIYRRLDREWKVTNTNFSGSFSMDMKLSTAYVTAIDIVLLVDDDGDFTNAQVFYPTVSYSGSVVTLTGITTAMIPANSTRYITIASINSRSALPVELIEFTVNLTANKKVRLNWRTATEINSDYFAIERSGNNMQWQEIGQVKAAGNSTQQLAYSFIDNNPLKGTSYYRLRQVDFDGKFYYSPVRLAIINGNGRVLAYPQPASDRITLEGVTGNSHEIMITDITGRVVTGKVKLISELPGRIIYDITSLPPAVYLIKTASGTVKVIKQQ